MGLNGGGGRYKLCHTQKTADSEVHIGQNTPPPPPEHMYKQTDIQNLRRLIQILKTVKYSVIYTDSRNEETNILKF